MVSPTRELIDLAQEEAEAEVALTILIEGAERHGLDRIAEDARSALIRHRRASRAKARELLPEANLTALATFEPEEPLIPHGLVRELLWASLLAQHLSDAELPE